MTFDYNAVTESVEEYMSAVCLCGHSNCRGSFLHFAAADCYQQVLQRTNEIAVRFAALLQSCIRKSLKKDDKSILARHGFNTAAFGAVSYLAKEQTNSLDAVPLWLQIFVVESLKYVEYERKALPVTLLCDSREREKKEKERYELEEREEREEKEGTGKSKGKGKTKKKKDSENPLPLTFQAADGEGASTMSNRIQSLTQSLSLVGRVLSRHRAEVQATDMQIDDGASSSSTNSNPPPPIPPIHAPIEILSHKEIAMKICVNKDSIIRSLIVAAEAARTPPDVISEMWDVYESFDRLATENMVYLDEAFVAAEARLDSKKCCLKIRDVLLKQKDRVSRSLQERFNAAIDLLMFYAKTDTFVKMKGYSKLESSAVEVFARELGNSVPRKLVPTDKKNDVNNYKIAMTEGNVEFYDADDSVASVAIKYPHDYVPNQLLHWFNGGVKTKNGPLQSTGCLSLPQPANCFKLHPHTFTYNNEHRKLVFNWGKDNVRKYTQWDNVLIATFGSANDHVDFMGSPILDGLLTGDGKNLEVSERSERALMKTSAYSR